MSAALPKPTPTDTVKSIQTALGVAPDGFFGPLSRAALDRAITAAGVVIKAVQTALRVTPDGRFGPVSRSALNRAIIAADSARVTHHGYASSFADKKDVENFQKCKLTGKTDQACFRMGDNGIGKWGTKTTLPRPMCALPPEDWTFLDDPDGAPVAVTIGKTTIVCELRDTMPARENIKNGCIVDLNEFAVRAFGLIPPVKKICSWRWLL